MDKFTLFDLYVVIMFLSLEQHEETTTGETTTGEEILDTVERATGRHVVGNANYRRYFSGKDLTITLRAALYEQLQFVVAEFFHSVDWGRIYNKLAPGKWVAERSGGSQAPNGPIRLSHSLYLEETTPSGVKEALEYMRAHAISKDVSEWLPAQVI